MPFGEWPAPKELSTDDYGGDLEGRSRFLVQVVDAVREVWPADRPLFVRLSATDWAPGGWDIGETVELARRLASHGVDLIDVTSGGLVPGARIEAEPASRCRSPGSCARGRPCRCRPSG